MSDGDIRDEIDRELRITLNDTDMTIRAYFDSLKRVNNYETNADHPLVCRKCKSNIWNMLKLVTPNKLRGKCLKCGRSQIFLKHKTLNQQFIQEVVNVKLDPQFKLKRCYPTGH